MDHSTVKRLAIQSGFQPDSVVFLPMLHSFAEKVIENFLAETGQYVTNDASREDALEQARAEEREACAKECEEAEIPFGIDVWMNSTKKEMTAATANALAAAIRARGQK